MFLLSGQNDQTLHPSLLQHCMQHARADSASYRSYASSGRCGTPARSTFSDQVNWEFTGLSQGCEAGVTAGAATLDATEETVARARRRAGSVWPTNVVVVLVWVVVAVVERVMEVEMKVFVTLAVVLWAVRTTTMVEVVRVGIVFDVKVVVIAVVEVAEVDVVR